MKIKLLASISIVVSMTASNVMAQEQGFPDIPSSTGIANIDVSQQRTMQAPIDPANPHNGVADLPPLTPPQPEDAQIVRNKVIERAASALTLEDMEHLIEYKKNMQKAAAINMRDGKSRTRSATVNLSPGAKVPSVTTLAGYITSVVFIDSTGEPWPIIATPRISSTKHYQVGWVKNSHIITISTLKEFAKGNVTLLLDGAKTPVTLNLSAPSDDKRNPVYDSRVDMRIPGRGPNAQMAILESTKIPLNEDVMQKFLDGIPPESAVLLHGDLVSADTTKIWRFNRKLYVRSNNAMLSAFESRMSAADGTRIYALPLTPTVTLSSNGKPLRIDISAL